MNDQQLIASLRYCDIEPLEIDIVNNRYVFVNLLDTISNFQIEILKNLGLDLRSVSLSFMNIGHYNIVDTMQLFIRINDMVEVEQLA